MDARVRCGLTLAGAARRHWLSSRPRHRTGDLVFIRRWYWVRRRVFIRRVAMALINRADRIGIAAGFTRTRRTSAGSSRTSYWMAAIGFSGR